MIVASRLEAVAPLASGEVTLADHPLLFAVPVLVPTLVIVVLVALVVVRDRRRNELDDLDLDADDPRREQSGPDDA